MGTDVLFQFGILIFALAIFYLLQHLPKRALSKLRSKTRPSIQANRHLLAGAQFLIRARSAQNKKGTNSSNLAKSAADEADKALAIQPREPAAHILKAMALDIMGHKNAALKSLDVALSPPIAKGLSEKEKGDALFKRAELQLALNRRRRVDSAVSDLVEAVKLNGDNCKAFCLLGHCYEIKNLKDEAKSAFKKSLQIDPGLVEARQGLDRLGP
ncbi:hypothetical protein M9H77_19601 [Catharanthus roseus]|uniref:Uncharacterized protein n=1 Tax=Catharanthus roseus TaxID=4058 RepID=A0ACC0BAW1_CATRO|nr:hypothetical protein M9H77_19601 [Catharanthus roseus]